MSLEVQTSAPIHKPWVAEDEIDLRQYLVILIRWWREIIAVTLGAVLLAGVVIILMRLILPAQYEATADVAIVRTVSDVNFDERFRTNPDSLGVDTISLSARRNALLGLVTTGVIAQEVSTEQGDVLSPEEQNPATLLAMVVAELATAEGVGSDSDLIRIKVTTDDADKAAIIATAWARSYVQTVNAIYSQVPDEVLNSIETELTMAQEQYQTSQSNLEAFIASNRIDELNSLVAVLQQRMNQEVSLQNAFLVQWQEAQEQLNTAQALRNQVQEGGEGAALSNMAALQVLKLRVFGMTPTNLQLEVRELPEIDQATMLADLDGLIAALSTRLADLNVQVAAGGTELSSMQEVTSTLTSVLTNLRSNKAQLETEVARQLQLTQQRDLQWETYKTLSNKVAELNLTRAAASSEVRFGAQAVPPIKPLKRISLFLGVMFAGAIGFVSGSLIALLANYMGKSPLWAKS